MYCLGDGASNSGESGRRRGVAVAGGLRLEVDLPRRHRPERLVRGVAPPHALDQHRGRGYLPVEVLLTLLLLDFERKAGPENTLNDGQTDSQM